MISEWTYSEDVGIAGGWHRDIPTSSGLVRVEVSDRETSWVWSFNNDTEIGFCNTKEEAMNEVEETLKDR